MTPEVKPTAPFTIPTGPIPPAAELLKRRWTIRELRRLPKEWQKAIMEAASEAAREYYLTDPEVREWDRCGQEDLNAESSNTETRRGAI
jgi:hypothetical protein